MRIPRRSLPALLAVSLAAALTASATATAAPTATAAATCDISKVATSLGPTQVTSLKATKVKCKDAISLVKAFHKCRLANGPAGRCVKKVKGYACRETRTSGPTEFTAKATCTKGKASVVHTYRQATG